MRSSESKRTKCSAASSPDPRSSSGARTPGSSSAQRPVLTCRRFSAPRIERVSDQVDYTAPSMPARLRKLLHPNGAEVRRRRADKEKRQPFIRRQPKGPSAVCAAPEYLDVRAAERSRRGSQARFVGQSMFFRDAVGQQGSSVPGVEPGSRPAGLSGCHPLRLAPV